MCESIFAKISTLKKIISLIFLLYLLIILFADVILQKRFCTHLKLLDVQIEDNKDNNCNNFVHKANSNKISQNTALLLALDFFALHCRL